MPSPCDPWPIDWSLCTEDDGADPALLAQAQTSAEALLWAMSGRRLGYCTWTEGYWPACSGDCGTPYKDAAGNWRNGGRGGDCCRLLLLHRPVAEVIEVGEHGVALDPLTYALDGAGWLRRIGACWPCGPECDDPPIEVTYRAGVGFPAGTDTAMGEVACEMLKGMTGGVCRLPSRATSISRQGITVDLGDPSEFLAAGRLGLPLADAWLAVVNPTSLDRASRVYSPDVARVT